MLKKTKAEKLGFLMRGAVGVCKKAPDKW